MTNHEFSIATDTGGTFVDTVLVRDDGEFYLGKASSPQGALIASIESAAAQAGITAPDALANARILINGTTVATNAMIERTGAAVGVLTTAGFEDTLIIGRVRSRTAGLDETEITDYQHAERPMPLGPVVLTRGITERVDFRGTVLLPVDQDDVIRRLDELREAGAETLAVSFLWSFRNPVHEQRVAEIARQRHPDLYVTLSSDLVPILREFERTNTTVVNSYLGPAVSRYVDNLHTSVARAGFARELLIMQSIGGLTPPSGLKRNPVTALQSGPVGGIIAAEKLGKQIGEPNLITTDMGGTSFDVGIVVDGTAQTQASTVVERNILAVPAVDVASIGAGGGSLAWLDELGALHVGPQSMGANPGPACYGAGGTLPTVTDADVALGYISPDYFAGGAMTLHPDRAFKAIEEHIAQPLGMSVEDAAEGIYRIVNAHMADLIRKVTVERGHDPRDFVLVSFGGCGPTHSTGYGPEIGVRYILIPRAASVFSAFGMAQSDMRSYFSRSIRPMTMVTPDGVLPRDDLGDINLLFASMLDQADVAIRRQDLDPGDASRQRYIEMRYRGQTNELTIPLQFDGPVDESGLRKLVEEFERRYEMLYGRGSSSSLSPIELITGRLDVAVNTPVQYALRREELQSGDPSEALVDERPVYWLEEGGYRPTPVYRGERLRPGNELWGPALIEAFGTTFPIRVAQRLEVDVMRNYRITI